MDRDFSKEESMRGQPFSGQVTLSAGLTDAEFDSLLRNGEGQPESRLSAGVVSRRLRVCVLEDSYKNMRAIFRALKKDGHEVDHFLKASDASTALEGGSYDALIISDTASGGAAGCDAFIARLRRSGREEFIKLPIVALTADESDERRRALHTAGASQVVSKFASQQLGDAILGIVAAGGAAPRVQHKRILLLEDSYRLSQRLSDALMSVGHEVDHVAAADEALLLARSCRHDAIVLAQCDAGSMTCEQLIERLLASKKSFDTATPIAVLTSSAETQNEQSLRLAGADLVLERNADQIEFHLVSWIQSNLLGAPSLSRGELPTLQSVVASAETSDIANVPGEALPPPELQDLQNAWWVEPGRNIKKIVAQNVAQNNATPRRWQFKLRGRISVTRIFQILVLVTGAFLLGWGFWAGEKPDENKTASTNTGSNISGVAPSIAVNGQVVSKRQVDLPATQKGQIYRVYVPEGRLVRKGEKLATLDNREAVIDIRRAEAQVFRYRIEIDFAERTLRELQADGAITVPRQMLLDVQESKALAETKLQVAEQDLRSAQLAIERLAITAPFSGVTVRCYALEGRWVEPGAPVYTLADLDALEVALRLDGEKTHSVSDIRVGQTVRFNANGVQWSEKILRVNSERDLLTPTGFVNRMLDGSSIAAYASVSEDAPALVLDEVVIGALVPDLGSTTDAASFAFSTRQNDLAYLNRVREPANRVLTRAGNGMRLD